MVKNLYFEKDLCVRFFCILVSDILHAYVYPKISIYALHYIFLIYVYSCVVMSIVAKAYLPLLRALRVSFPNDLPTERKVLSAVRLSVFEMESMNFSPTEIAAELESTKTMLFDNLAQVEYNAKLDSYALKLEERHVPSNGSVVDIKTPADLMQADSSLDDITGRFSQK